MRGSGLGGVAKGTSLEYAYEDADTGDSASHQFNDSQELGQVHGELDTGLFLTFEEVHSGSLNLVVIRLLYNSYTIILRFLDVCMVALSPCT